MSTAVDAAHEFHLTIHPHVSVYTHFRDHYIEKLNELVFQTRWPNCIWAYLTEEINTAEGNHLHMYMYFLSKISHRSLRNEILKAFINIPTPITAIAYRLKTICSKDAQYVRGYIAKQSNYNECLIMHGVSEESYELAKKFYNSETDKQSLPSEINTRRFVWELANSIRRENPNRYWMGLCDTPEWQTIFTNAYHQKLASGVSHSHGSEQDVRSRVLRLLFGETTTDIPSLQL